MENAKRMKSVLMVAAFVFLLSCDAPKHGEALSWHTIAIGDYLVDCPADFELINEKGIDSHVGKLKGDSLTLYFDFGYYSGDFAPTPEQYVESNTWRMEASEQFMEQGRTYSFPDLPKVDVLSVRVAAVADRLKWKGCDYVARCRHEESDFDFPVYLPEETEKRNFAIDTIGTHYRKLVTAKDPTAGITGIYIKDLNGFNESINSPLALSIATDRITKSQQKLVVKILATVRPNPGK